MPRWTDDLTLVLEPAVKLERQTAVCQDAGGGETIFDTY